MRNKERVPLVLDIINWFNFIQNNTGLSKLDENLSIIVNNIKDNEDKIKEYWLDCPDLRLGQLLIIKGFAPDQLGSLWYIEEDDWLIKEDYCNIEDIKFWGRNYDKDMNRLSCTEYVLLKNLTTDHIEAIIKYFKDIGRDINPEYLKYFKERIKSNKTDVYS